MKERPGLNMNSTGSPKPETAGRRGWGVIALAGILVALAVVVAVPLLGVLYGVLFPAAPPTLDSFVVSTHSSPSYGVDDWLYGSPDDACRVARFYESMGAECTIAPQSCESGEFISESSYGGVNVARCVGEIQWSIFAQRYHVNIAGGYGESMPTRIRLEREIFWTGTLPARRN